MLQRSSKSKEYMLYDDRNPVTATYFLIGVNPLLKPITARTSVIERAYNHSSSILDFLPRIAEDQEMK